LIASFNAPPATTLSPTNGHGIYSPWIFQHTMNKMPAQLQTNTLSLRRQTEDSLFTMIETITEHLEDLSDKLQPWTRSPYSFDVSGWRRTAAFRKETRGLTIQGAKVTAENVSALLLGIEWTHYSEITFTHCAITEAALAYLAKWTPTQRRNYSMSLAHQSHYATLDTVRLRNCGSIAIGDVDEPESVEWSPSRCAIRTFELDGETGLDGNTLENVANYFVVSNNNLRELVLHCTKGATVTTTTVLQKLLAEMSARVDNGDGEQRKLSLDVYMSTFEVADILKRVMGHHNCFIDILTLRCSYDFAHLGTVMEGIGDNGGSLEDLHVRGVMCPKDLETLLDGLSKNERVKLESLRLPEIFPWNDDNLEKKLASFLRQQTKITDMVLPSMGMDSFELCNKIDEDMFLLQEDEDTEEETKKEEDTKEETKESQQVTFTKTQCMLHTIDLWAKRQEEKGNSSAEQLAADVLTGIFHFVQSGRGLADIMAAGEVAIRQEHEPAKKRRKTVHPSHHAAINTTSHPYY
jgi:hypothetical protein